MPQSGQRHRPSSAERSTAAPEQPHARTSRRSWNATDLSLIAVFAALTAAFALIPAIPVGAAGVPVTLQTLAVMLTGVVLGPGRGAAAIGLYVAAGLAGLPIFSGFSGGLGVLAGPTAGYLLAFPLAAALAGWLSTVAIRRARRLQYLLLFLACAAGSILVIHPLGIAGMMLNLNLDPGAALMADIVFLPGDIAKNLIAAAVGVSVHKAFPRLLDR
ncbi:biotin transporter BioY [Arthrobacter castelli]|uniref:biotin transporter BioY n=1 Tax=Arthrobacter castelli TaxID=271431 RepID=UPI0004291461|nr:biotin transporter BioY [Arthrobacter castelli]